MREFAKELFQKYEELALTGDDKKTAQDFNLRDLEIEFALPYIKSAQNVLDIGCGLGYTTRKYASQSAGKIVGLDYSPNMIEGAKKISSNQKDSSRIIFTCQSVVQTNFNDAQFDVIVSHRCLMALLDWNLQKNALVELARILKKGGVLILFEGTLQGLNRLNSMRKSYGLDEIDGTGQGGLLTLKFDEDMLEEFLVRKFYITKKQNFGTYYFLTRIFYPIHIAPEVPSFDNPFSRTAKELSLKNPELVDIGHLRAYALTRK